MRILWLCNILLPEIAQSIGADVLPVGGWMTGQLNGLFQKEPDSKIGIVCPYKKEMDGTTDRFDFFTFVGENETIKSRFEKIIKEYSPDVIHIFGSEYYHTLAMVETCEKMNLLDSTVISVQGLKSVYAKHFFAALPISQILGFTLRDIIKCDNVFLQRKRFVKNGKDEIAAFKNAKHVIGRTDWDKACIQQINPNAKYHFCNEILRDSFYENKWDYNSCEKHSIFTSQSTYPIKGFHLMLEAMPEILKCFPDAHLYTTGRNPVLFSKKQKFCQSNYDKYIAKLIKQLKLENNVTFLGTLDEKAMCEKYCKSNVFVSCSSIENSPNSLGEAMLLGVPSVTSDVGGVKNMLTHNEEGFIYSYDEAYMVAFYVCQIFEKPDLAQKISQNAKSHAEITHRKDSGIESLINIYKELSAKE